MFYFHNYNEMLIILVYFTKLADQTLNYGLCKINYNKLTWHKPNGKI